MSKVVYKYKLEETKTVTVLKLKLSKVVLFSPQIVNYNNFQVNSRGLHVWVELDEMVTEQEYEFAIVGTSHQVPKGFEHVMSTMDAPYVWHLYYRVKP